MDNHFKGIFIEDICEGIVTGKFKIVKIDKRITKTGSEFLQIELKDKTGTIKGLKFSSGLLSENDKNIREGNVYHINGIYSKQYNSIRINKIKKCQENEYNETDYENKHKNPKELMNIIYETINSIKDVDIKLILKLFFEDDEFIKKFYDSPAAFYYHHNYKNGLLEHTANVLSICKNLTILYPKLNYDLLCAGAILHDIGKIKVYNLQETNIEYTEYGKLMGHIYIGSEMVKYKTKNKLIDQNKINKIVHLILSHHGEKELGYGSTVDPQLPEAIALHHADNLDATLKNHMG